MFRKINHVSRQPEYSQWFVEWFCRLHDSHQCYQ